MLALLACNTRAFGPSTRVTQGSQSFHDISIPITQLLQALLIVSSIFKKLYDMFFINKISGTIQPSFIFVGNLLFRF